MLPHSPASSIGREHRLVCSLTSMLLAGQSLRETARMQSAESDAKTLLDELSAASGSGIEKV